MTAFASLTATPLRNDTPANPRWAACTRELGREPSVGEYDRWHGRRWADYLESIGLGALTGSAKSAACNAHKRAFEAWLTKRGGM